VRSQTRQPDFRRLPPLTLLIVFLSSISAFAQQAEISVGLLRYFGNVTTLCVRGKSQITVSSRNPASGAAFSVRGAATFAAEGENIRISAEQLADTTLDCPVEVSSADLLSLNNGDGKWHSYKGVLLLDLNGRRIRVVNKIPIEDYLLGVLPAEMPAGFKEEALKAQAIAARTYAYRGIGKHGSVGFDVCDGTHCQSYLGADGEKQACTRAVQETAGMVLVNDTGFITPLYSADCGGRTRSGGTTYNCLTSVADTPEDSGEEFCANGANHTWTVKVTKTHLVAAISRTVRLPIQQIETVSLSAPGPDGRPENLIVMADGKERKIAGYALQKSLGNGTLKSPWLTAVSLDGEEVVFEGRGHGHGYGLCQIGANGMASAPHNKAFTEILAHYYPGSQLTTIAELPVAARPPTSKIAKTSPAPRRAPELPPLILFEP